MVSLGQNAHQLRQLKLDYCTQLSWRACAPLAACPSLESLSVNVGEWGVNKDQPQQCVKREIHHLMRLARLTTLEIHQVSSYFIHKLARLASKATVWPHLTKLTLTDDSDMDDATVDNDMARFLPTHRGITDLSLIGIDISNDTLDTIGTCLANALIHLDVSLHFQITALGVRALVHQCPFLVSVTLEHCDVYTKAFPGIASNCMGGQRGRKIFLLDQDAIHHIRLGPFTCHNDIYDDDEYDDD